MMKRHRGGKQKGFVLGKDRPVEQVTKEQLPANLAAMGWKETEIHGQGQSRVFTNPAHPGAQVWTATTTGKAGLSWGHYENNGHDIVQGDFEYAGAGKEHKGTPTGLIHYLSGLRALDEIATLERVWALPARGPA